MYFPSLTYFHQNDQTALMHATKNGHFEVTEVLVEAGASIEAKDNVSKRISIFTYIFVRVCVEREGGRGDTLPSLCMISEKYHLIQLLYFITICSI